MKKQKNNRVYPALHGRAFESSAIAGLSQNSPGGQGGHSSTAFSPLKMESEPMGQGSGKPVPEGQ